MRVIAGEKRGMTLSAPAGTTVTRPTSDRAREAIFGSIQFSVRGAQVLDICAGSGAMGIEALSRGAERCVFVDADAAAAQAIGANIDRARYGQRAVLMREDCLRAIDLLAERGESFDYAFFDPPYAAGLYEPVLDRLAQSGIMAEEHTVIVETAAEGGYAPDERWELLRDKRYGKARMLFLRLPAEKQQPISEV